MCVKQNHFAAEYAYIIVNRDGEAVESGSCCVGKAVNHFIHIVQQSRKMSKFSKGYNKFNMIKEDMARFNEQTRCLLCKHEILKVKG